MLLTGEVGTEFFRHSIEIRALTRENCPPQEMFCKQKGYLEEELDYRKSALDQAYTVTVAFPLIQPPAFKYTIAFLLATNMFHFK